MEYESDWLDVERLLPQTEEQKTGWSPILIVCNTNNNVFVTRYNIKEKCWPEGYKITHWMPLPTPPIN